MDDREIDPPASMTVEHEHRPRLYLADGTPLVRQAGFTAGRGVAMQTSGTHPGLSDGTRKTIMTRPPKPTPKPAKMPMKMPAKRGGKGC